MKAINYKYEYRNQTMQMTQEYIMVRFNLELEILNFIILTNQQTLLVFLAHLLGFTSYKEWKW